MESYEHDSEQTDLVQLLVLEAGQLLEDASADFAMSLPSTGPARTKQLRDMLEIIETTRTLVLAALRLAETTDRYSSTKLAAE